MYKLHTNRERHELLCSEPPPPKRDMTFLREQIELRVATNSLREVNLNYIVTLLP